MPVGKGREEAANSELGFPRYLLLFEKQEQVSNTSFCAWGYRTRIELGTHMTRKPSIYVSIHIMK